MCRFLLIALLLVAPARAQLVAGPWVDRAEARIEAHRKADLEVLVLGPGDRPVAGAEVAVTQLRHAFPFGVELPPGSPELIEKVADPDRAVWRGLSAVSLEADSAWSRLQPAGPVMDAAAAASLERLLDAARARGLRVRLSALAPGDAADRPTWAVGLVGPEREAAARGFLDALAALAAGRAHAADLVSSASDRPWLAAPAVRRLGQAARVAWATPAEGGTGPGAWLGLGVRDGLSVERGGEVLAAADALRGSFVPVDGVTTGLRLRRGADAEDLERALQRLETFDLDAAVAPVEVGGDAAEQPFTLEAALTLLFAEPRVREVHFGGVEPGRPESLFDAAGNPTDGGKAVDFLLAERWWTATTGTTDALGVARFRVFAGKHAVAAVLPGGASAEVEAGVPIGEEPTRVVVSADRD